MPNIKSAEKRLGTNEKRRQRNKSVSSQVKTKITRAEGLLAAGDLESAGAAVTVATSALDKAAEKKVIHRNNASRRKSRLQKKLNQAVTASKAEPIIETKEAE
ncbi:MAG: 30S ribosomal protein S20 [Chloroflexota bacterium]